MLALPFLQNPAPIFSWLPLAALAIRHDPCATNPTTSISIRSALLKFVNLIAATTCLSDVPHEDVL